MQKRILLLISLFLSLSAFSQGSYIEIGDGEDACNQPAYSSWEYSYCSMMYTGEELGDAKTITHLAFNNNVEDLVQWGADFTMTNQKLWIKHTDATSFQSYGGTNYDYENPHNPSNGYTLVFDGEIYYGPLGWTVIELNTPFEYNGSQSIILHWENEYGEVKFSFKHAGTKMGDECMVKCWGNEYAVPHTSGYMYSENIRVNTRFFFDAGSSPETPAPITPLSGEIKTDLSTQLVFNIGENTDTYSILMGSTEDNMSEIASNVSVDGAGEYAYTFDEILTPDANYFWQVVASNASESVEGPVSSFHTQEHIVDFPLTCDFDEYWVSYVNPSDPDTLSAIINTNYKDLTPWEFSNNWLATYRLQGRFEGNFTPRCSPYGIGEYYLMTPRMNLPENQRMSFYWINTGLITNMPTTYVQISTDGKQTWNTVAELRATTNMEEYKLEIIDLDEYSGHNVYIRWNYIETVSGNYSCGFMFDMLKIENQPTQANITFDVEEYDYPEACEGAKLRYDLKVHNTGIGNLEINGGTSEGPFHCDYVGNIPAGNSKMVPIYFEPTAAGDYESTFTFNVGSATGNPSLTLKAKAVARIDEFFQNFDLVKELPEDWKAIQSGSASHIVQNIWVTEGSTESFSPPYALKMNRINAEDKYDSVILVSPGTHNYSQNKLTFQAKKAADTYELSLIVGVMTDPYDASSFVPEETIDLTSEFKKYEVSFKHNTTEPYIGFMYGQYTPDDPFPYASLRIDDIAWEEADMTPPEPAEVAYPTHQASNVDIYRDVVLRWAAGSADTDGYFISIGTTEDANDILAKTDLGLDFDYPMDYNFTYSTKYFWKIIPYNQYGECTEGLETWEFTTMADPTVSDSELPLVEGFDETINVSNRVDCPIGWSIIDTHNDNFTWDAINVPPANINMTRNGSFGSMHVLFSMYNPKDDWLFTPPIEMTAASNYNVEFYLHTIFDLATNKFYNEEIEVWIGKDKNADAMNVKLTEDNVNDDVWKKVEKTFTVDEDGTYYIGLRAVSDAGAYLLIVDDFKLEKSTSINEMNAQNVFGISPNPANAQAVISINKPENTSASIQLINTLGQCVYQVSSQKNEYHLNLNQYDTGMYLVVVKTSEGQFTQKLIIE